VLYNTPEEARSLRNFELQTLTSVQVLRSQLRRLNMPYTQKSSSRRAIGDRVGPETLDLIPSLSRSSGVEGDGDAQVYCHVNQKHLRLLMMHRY
jgi:hypothetical protein